MTRGRRRAALVPLLAFLAAFALARFWPSRRAIGAIADARPPDLSRFDGAIRRAASESSVDADLLRALVVAESGGNPDATSDAGARGLTQLMPETAKAEARALSIAASFDIEDPSTNLRLGAHYLARMRDDLGGSDALALAAYNAGKANALRWRLRAVDCDGAGAVDREAFPETRYYVERVMRLRQAYEKRR